MNIHLFGYRVHYKEKLFDFNPAVEYFMICNITAREITIFQVLFIEQNQQKSELKQEDYKY